MSRLDPARLRSSVSTSSPCSFRKASGASSLDETSGGHTLRLLPGVASRCLLNVNIVGDCSHSLFFFGNGAKSHLGGG